MKNFEFQNPTKLIFGRGEIARLSKVAPKGKKILVTFGGGSVRHNGVYDQVKAALTGFDVTEFWGIEPNPKVETLRKAVEVCKKQNIEFILAVGGGSVLDGTKLIAAAAVSDHDAWELVIHNELVKGTLPFASVMTLPATGSEMNSGAVISRLETGEKYAFYNTFPIFSILDPETTYSLPKFQRACGLADTFIHVLEQYLTTPNQSPLMDRWAEGILQTLVEVAPEVMSESNNYDAMSTFMLSATMALNGFIAMGVTEDWSTHMIGHEITALSGITHGQTLAIVVEGTMNVMRDEKGAKIVQYGKRVWGIGSGSDEERIADTVAATERFFRSIGLATRLTEIGVGQDIVDEIVARFEQRHTLLGENSTITPQKVRAILEQRL
ncbi:MAG: iron-containing alcohol dehydrogenase [Tidjanibacter sp.]|nr:iron-containing alcohol dehydrogenase [Tidjanibacter sp.]